MFFGKSFNPEKDIPDLSGKVILVTGGNTGLGKETVLQLAKHNPSQIFLAARNPSKAEAAIADVKKVVPTANITFLPLDLTSLKSVDSAAKSFQSQSKRLDLLYNNAGIMAVPAATTQEGYEIQFGTNHIGHALLTKLLLPTMLKTAEEPNADVRIINLSSMGHQMAPTKGIDFDNLSLSNSSPWTRYGQSKLANILFAKELAKRYPTITSISVHPGIIKTDLYDAGSKTNALLRNGVNLLGGLVMGSIETGSKNQLWAGVSKDVVNGAYYTPIGSNNGGSGYAQDDKLATSLWDWTEEELAKYGY